MKQIYTSLLIRDKVARKLSCHNMFRRNKTDGWNGSVLIYVKDSTNYENSAVLC